MAAGAISDRDQIQGFVRHAAEYIQRHGPASAGETARCL